jgi:hypothetical protein
MSKKTDKKIGRGGIEYEDLGYIELAPALAADIARRIDKAEEDLSATSVNFRWHKEQLAVVKKVAEMMGVSYQTYIKMIVYKQALADFHVMTGQIVQPTEAPRTVVATKQSRRKAQTRRRA